MQLNTGPGQSTGAGWTGATAQVSDPRRSMDESVTTKTEVAVQLRMSGVTRTVPDGRAPGSCSTASNLEVFSGELVALMGPYVDHIPGERERSKLQRDRDGNKSETARSEHRNAHITP